MAQKWEYCAVGPVKVSQTLEGHYPWMINFKNEGLYANRIQKQGQLNERDILAQTIAKLGDEGWEMVGMGTVPGAGSGEHNEPAHLIYFKRPKSE